MIKPDNSTCTFKNSFAYEFVSDKKQPKQEEQQMPSGKRPISLMEEKRLIIDSASMGAEMVLKRLGLAKDDISQNEAFRIYGRAQVESWVNDGYVTRAKGGSKSNCKAYYSRIELETVADLWRKRNLKSKELKSLIKAKGTEQEM